MTDTEWARAAAHFGVAPEDVPHYRQAIADVEAMGVDAFADALQAELTTALSAVPAPQAVVNRLVIRKTVLVEVYGAVAHDALQAFDGPQH